MKLSPDAARTTRERASSVICQLKRQEAIREAGEIKRLLQGGPSAEFGAELDPRLVKESLMLQYRGGTLTARLSCYFAIEALNTIESDAALAEELTVLAEESAREEFEEVLVKMVRNKRSARFPRPDFLTQTITKILSSNLSLTWKEVLRKIEAIAESGDGIQTVTDETVEWTDNKGRVQTTNTTGIKDRVSRVKALIRSN